MNYILHSLVVNHPCSICISEKRSQADNPETNGPNYPTAWRQLWLFWNNAGRRRMQDLHYFDPYHLPRTAAPHIKSSPIPEGGGGHSPWGASLLCLPLCQAEKSSHLSLPPKSVSDFLFGIGAQRSRDFVHKMGLLRDLLAGRRLRRARRPDRKLGDLSPRPSGERSVRGYPWVQIARDSLPQGCAPSHPARRLGCGTPRLRQRTRERLTQHLPGFFCLKDTFSFLARAGLDFHSEKTLNIGGSERGHTEVATHPVSAYGESSGVHSVTFDRPRRGTSVPIWGIFLQREILMWNSPCKGRFWCKAPLWGNRPGWVGLGSHVWAGLCHMFLFFLSEHPFAVSFYGLCLCVTSSWRGEGLCFDLSALTSNCLLPTALAKMGSASSKVPPASGNF